MSIDWHGKKVLVTGAGGFIASHLVETLSRSGAIVRAMVRYNSRGAAGFLNQSILQTHGTIEIFPGDLCDRETVRQAVKDQEYVFHLGALISIPFSYRYPDAVVSTNIIGTMNILQACREMGTPRLIHTSTSEVYGSAKYVPIDELHPLQGQSPYSASKIAADKLAESFYCAYGLPVVTVRPFNTYGPRQSARAVIPAIICQVLSRDTLLMGNKDTTRDFTFVSDTVQGFIKAAEAQQSVLGDVFNLGTGTEISIGALAQTIITITGKAVKIVQDPNRLRPEKSEVTRLLSNNQKAQKALGWQPTVSLQGGIETTIDWIRNHLDLYDPDHYVF
ncbi:MAG: GDP-mannose 4,6-dehydratase [Anaerolineae bacterium]|nr:GDP-mannose 4,6-dehydratase [Anaerolineae bacterium]